MHFSYSLPVRKGFLELVNHLSSLTSETIDQSIRHQLPSKLPNVLHDSIANRSLSSIHHRLFSQLSLSEFNQQLVWTIYQPTNSTTTKKMSDQIRTANQSVNQSFNQLINSKMSKSDYYILSIVDHGWMYFIKAITGAWVEIFQRYTNFPNQLYFVSQVVFTRTMSKWKLGVGDQYGGLIISPSHFS